MAMGLGGQTKVEMNVTPLIDVLLVLLIIFLVIQPPRSHGLKAEAPPSGKSSVGPPRDDIVITVLRDHKVRLNQEPVELSDLEGRLHDLFKNAVHHVIFVRGGKDLDFEQVAQVIDIARGAGLEKVALMPE
jgi:biopolymer transport protein TolR